MIPMKSMTSGTIGNGCVPSSFHLLYYFIILFVILIAMTKENSMQE